MIWNTCPRAASFDTRMALRYNAPTWCAQVAQMVEQWTENPRVRGSIPRLGTTFNFRPVPADRRGFFFWPFLMLDSGSWMLDGGSAQPPGETADRADRRRSRIPLPACRFERRSVAPPGLVVLRIEPRSGRGAGVSGFVRWSCHLSHCWSATLQFARPFQANNATGGSSRVAHRDTGRVRRRCHFLHCLTPRRPRRSFDPCKQC